MKVIQLCAIDQTMSVLLKELSLHLVSEGYEVIGVCSHGKFTRELKRQGLNIVNIKIDRKIKPLSNIRTIYELYKLFKKEKPDIVHVHTPIAGVLGRIAAKLAKIPNIIYTAHGFYFHENMKKVKYTLYLHIEKFMAIFFTDYIFTQSEEDRLTALKNNLIDDSKIIKIGNGVDVYGRFNPSHINEIEIEELYRELNLCEEDKIITFIGRMVEEKGILDLLEAFNKLGDERVKLLVVGNVEQFSRDIDTTDVMKNYQSNNGNIIFTGFRSDVQNILYITDIFCLPSYREGMPRSIIEAMAMGCAVIATNIRGSREEVIDNKTGFLVNLNAPSEITSKIKTLLDDESTLCKMKKEARSRAQAYFNEEKVIGKQLEIFKKLCKENKL